MKFNFLILLASAMLLSACGNSYNTQFPPPTGEEKYADIVPAEIGGEAGQFEKLELEEGVYHGARFAFGDKASIVMVQCSNQDAIDSYFKGAVVPKLEDGYSSKVSGKFNGVWSARASGGSGRIQAWQNGTYVFVLQADSDELFDEIVEKFSYIAKK